MVAVGEGSRKARYDIPLRSSLILFSCFLFSVFYLEHILIPKSIF